MKRANRISLEIRRVNRDAILLLVPRESFAQLFVLKFQTREDGE